MKVMVRRGGLIFVAELPLPQSRVCLEIPFIIVRVNKGLPSPFHYVPVPFPHPPTSPGSSTSTRIVSGTISSTHPIRPLFYIPWFEEPQSQFAGPIAKLACIFFSVSFTCLAALGIYCPTTKHLLQSRADPTRQIQTLASFQPVEGSEEERATAQSDDLTAANGWRFYVNIRFGVALNFAEGANMARAMVHATVVLLLALAAGCTGFVTSVAALSVTWLVPSARRGVPPVITEKRQRYMPLVRRQAPPLPRSAGAHKRAESVPVPRPEPVRHVSFEVDELDLTTPASAPSSPRGGSILLPHSQRSHIQHSGAVLLPIMAADSPLSSAETLSETPAEVKRAFSSRLTRVLRGRRHSRSSTIASTTASSSSATVSSEFGEHVIPPGKVETRPISDVKQRTERGRRFTFLKKSKTIDAQTRDLPPTSRTSPLSLPSPLAPLTSNTNSSADSLPLPRRTDSPIPLSSSFSTGSEPSQHRRVMSNPSASPKLRLTDKVCPRKEKDKGAEPKPKPKPARTQPYGPPYNWIPPTPGAWAVTGEADKHITAERQRKRVSAPVVASIPEDVTRPGHEPSGNILRPRRPTIK